MDGSWAAAGSTARWRQIRQPGARQVGKSTLVELIAAQHTDAELRTLGRPSTLEAATDDSLDFVNHPGLLIIDEIRRAPRLFLPIKYQVDSAPPRTLPIQRIISAARAEGLT
ncbi:MAG: AAA family ATPase [Terriglobales bacterium]